MDALSDMVRGVRAHGSLFGTAILEPPWHLRFPQPGPLTLCTVLQGTAWVLTENHPPERLDAGSTVLLRTGFDIVDRPQTPAAPLVCDEHCLRPEEGGATHYRGWYDPPRDRTPSPEATSLLVSAYTTEGEVSQRLLAALPLLARLPDDKGSAGVMQHVADELTRDDPGQQVVLDRLLDWMLVCSLREWFDQPANHPPSWWAAQRDPVVGQALRHLHDHPAAPWTVATLAERVGVARATLAKKFTETVGEPPLSYLTGWRMTLAADLLAQQPHLSLANVARQVGYADPFGFSAAFKRVRGQNPSEWRRTSTSRDAAGRTPARVGDGSPGVR